MRYKIKYEYVEYYEEYEFLEADSIEEAKLKFEKMKIWEDYEPRASWLIATSHHLTEVMEDSESE
jgi:hypothetical protein